MSTEPLRTEDVSVVTAICGHSNCKGAGTYTLKVGCINCGWKGTIKITRGHEFSSYSAACPHCGCYKLTS